LLFGVGTGVGKDEIGLDSGMAQNREHRL